MILPQLIVNGLISGAQIALVASGFAIIYATNRFVHFAHGAIVSAGGYLVYFFIERVAVPFWFACVLAIVGTGFLGWLCYVFFYKPLRARRSSGAVLLIASLGLMVLFQNILLIIFGAGVKSISVGSAQAGLSIYNIVITPLQLFIIGVTIVMLILGILIMRFTKWGKMLRAVADNPELAATTGIGVERIAGASFFIGSALAGGAGILIGLEQNLSPFAGTNLIVQGFTGAVVGGIGSLPGALLGSYLSGLVQNLGIWFLPSGYKEAIAFTLLIIFLLFRPQGILGINKGVKE